MTDTGTLASKLAAARSVRGWSLRDAERRSGVRNAHLSQIETGGIRRPELNILMRLASAYDLPLESLILDAGYDAAIAAAFAEAVRPVRPPEPETPDLASLPWRIGSHVGRTVYAITGTGDHYQDVLIGVMDSPELAAEAVGAHNERLGSPA